MKYSHYITSSYTYQFLEKNILFLFKGEGLLSTLLLLIYFLNIVTWKHRFYSHSYVL